MYKAALFDLDGTLTDSLNLSAQAFIHTFRKHLQREYTPEEIFAMFGPCEEGIFRQADAGQCKAMLETFLEFYRRCHNQYATVYPGVIPALKTLKKHMPLAIITGKGKKPAEITLEETGLTPYFDLVVSGSCVERHKPDPQGINMVLQALGVSPQQAFYLGDSPGDIQAARQAGVTALAAIWGIADAERLLRHNPDAAFAAPAELVSWVQRNQT